MESLDSSPSQNLEGSEYDDIISVSSSTIESAIVKQSLPPKGNSGIKYRTNNKRIQKNIKSFRRRAKSRMVDEFDDASSYHHDFSVDQSNESPNYLKATSSSQGKKSNLQASSRHSESAFDTSDKSSSHSSLSKLGSRDLESWHDVSRTNNVRNMRFLIRKSSFKPKRPLLNYSQVSKDVSVNRATYSSTVKDSKFVEPLLIQPVEMEPEKNPALKVCRYHHCSLHGCRGTHESIPLPNRFVQKRKTSLKKQRSIKPRSESLLQRKHSDERKRNLESSVRRNSVVESSVHEGKSVKTALSSPKSNKNDVDSFMEVFEEPKGQLFGDVYGDIQETYLAEIAFGETSFPERSYHESLNIMRKYTPKEQDFGEPGYGINGYCLKCSCIIREQIEAPPSGDDVDSSRGNEYNHDVAQGGDADVSETSSLALFHKPDERVHIDDSSGSREGSSKGPETPIKFDMVTKDIGEFSSVSDGQTSSEVGEFPTESTTMEGKNTDTHALTKEGVKPQFSEQRHMSMWHLIHQHMLSGSAEESLAKPHQGADGEDQVDGANLVLAEENSASGGSFSDIDVGIESNDFEIQEVELRKSLAIKLVREAIEKILLPEIQDQTSDDQSITSEDTPRPELIQEKPADDCTEEVSKELNAKGEEGNAVSDSGKENTTADVTSSPEKVRTGKMLANVSVKKAPKHWSNLKKWILLQRFIRELEKVRKFNPRKPKVLPLNPDPEAENVKLRSQSVDERKRAEEWMLDYALRQAVNQLAPTQQRKVALLVKAFETVVPPKDESQVLFRIPRLEDNSLDNSGDNGGSNLASAIQESGAQPATKNAFESSDEPLVLLHRSTDEKHGEKTGVENPVVSSSEEPEDQELGNVEPFSSARSLILDGGGISEEAEKSFSPASRSDAQVPKVIDDEKETEANPDLNIIQGDGTSDGGKEDEAGNAQFDRQGYIKMWHMVYQHVVSGIAEKVGSQLLDAEDDDEFEENRSTSTNNGDHGQSLSKSTDYHDSEFTKTDAIKLIKEAVDEILLPDEKISKMNRGEAGEKIYSSEDNTSLHEEEVRPEPTKEVRPEMKKSKNWSKLKKLLILKRSIRALEKARELKLPSQPSIPQMPDSDKEKADLRRQMMDERKKAEQWMLDYAVQHIVTKLNPSRKRRVSMLVEAFEAVVPLPE